MRTSNNNRSGYILEQAESVFSRFPLWHYIIVKLGADKGWFICNSTIYSTIYITTAINCIFKILSEKGVHVYRVNIPDRADVIEENRAGYICKDRMAQYLGLIHNYGVNPPDYIEKITDVSPKNLHPSKLLHGKTIGENRKTIFLVGPCIVGGWENPEGERLGEILYDKLQKVGIDYQISFVAMNDDRESNMKEILEKDIRKNDIVILFGYSLSRYELNTTPLYNDYKGTKFLYTNHPVHTTVTANKLIADELINKIVKPLFSALEEDEDNWIVYHGRTQFTPLQENEISNYAKIS